IPLRSQSVARRAQGIGEIAARQVDIQHDHRRRQQIARPHEATLATHGKPLHHGVVTPTISPIQRAWRSRRNTAPRARVSTMAPKYSRKASIISRSGVSMLGVMEALPNFSKVWP